MGHPVVDFRLMASNGFLNRWYMFTWKLGFFGLIFLSLAPDIVQTSVLWQISFMVYSAKSFRHFVLNDKIAIILHAALVELLHRWSDQPAIFSIFIYYLFEECPSLVRENNHGTKEEEDWGIMNHFVLVLICTLKQRSTRFM